MLRKLAIKGHATRGKEVIELLKMMGGSDYGVSGNIPNHYYYLDTPTHIDAFAFESDFFIRNKNNFAFYTLEEFLEEYPLKIGELKDLVCDHLSCVITEMRWNEQAQCVEYHTEFGPNDYGWHRIYDFCSDYQIEESNEVISGIYLNSCDYADEVELNLGDYEIEVRDGKTYAIRKKPTYPKTVIEVLDYWHPNREPEDNYQYIYKKDLIKSFQLLLYCRDAYWKIAGVEMGLDKDWKYDMSKDEFVYAITYQYGEIQKNEVRHKNHILAFPTKEMRDAFYENFKDLIEQCKELL